jgi:hypothetical protein
MCHRADDQASSFFVLNRSLRRSTPARRERYDQAHLTSEVFFVSEIWKGLMNQAAGPAFLN